MTIKDKLKDIFGGEMIIANPDESSVERVYPVVEDEEDFSMIDPSKKASPPLAKVR